MPELRLPYTPQPRQLVLHQTKARQILYGGAAGGGKSKAIRWDGIAFCLQNAGCQAYLFRRSLNELEKNHIVPLRRELPSQLGLGNYNETRKCYEFKNGSILWMCFCDREQDVTIYQGAEMHWIGIDEAAHMTPFQIGYLKSRNRLGDWTPEIDKDRLPRFVMGSNPGGPGHNYLKQIFLNQAPPETIFHDTTMRNPNDSEDKGWPSIFIPAKIADNKFIDVGYEASFGGLPPELARALREGDWDAVVGQALHTLSRTRHGLRPFKPPIHWTRFQVIDWGTASPFSIGWYCVSDGAELAGKEGYPPRWLPSGAVIRYAEWYGWNGQSNQGCRLAPQSVAKGIIEKETQRNEIMDYRIGDTEMWAMKSGPSVQEWFLEADPRLVMRRAEKDRKRNYQEIQARLAGNPRFLEDGTIEEDPMFFVTLDCTHFWRTTPSLTLDLIDPEKGPDTKLEDHCLHGLTRIYTDKGMVCLKDAGDATRILTHEGWREFIFLGKTGENVPVWKLRLVDGQEIIATPSHKFLCADGQYRRLDEITYNDYIVCSQDFPYGGEHWPSISTERRIGNAGATIKDTVSAFIGLYGSILTGLSRAGCMCIIKTATRTITQSKIWNWFPQASICNAICGNQTELPMLSGIWKQECVQKPLSGTSHKMGWHGIPSAANSMARFRRVSLLYARNAVRKVWRRVESGAFVPTPAIKNSFGVGILDIIRDFGRADVYNLHVPKVNAFIVEAGTIVHNCYDEVVYGLRSRPYVTTEDDRWWQKYGNEYNEAIKRGGDPYAT